MAQLAIKGHPTRGGEVIQLLKMLGGNNNYSRYCGYNTSTNTIYYIDFSDHNFIKMIENPSNNSDFIVFTLEEFEEKFPYKVGDKVQYKGATSCGSVYVIEQMKWEDNQVKYVICDLYWKNCKCIVISKDLQPYKEETVETLNNKTNKAIFETNAQSCDIMNDIIKKEDMKEKGDKAKAPNLIGEDYSGKRFGYKIPQGYEVDCIQNNEIIIKPIKPKYPKTYIECAKTLNCFSASHIDGYKNELLDNLQELLICRDAYWKIYGEQMGLGKSWEPDWNNQDDCYHAIKTCKNESCLVSTLYLEDCILAFPTEEMRDAFFENFNDLINECKELL